MKRLVDGVTSDAVLLAEISSCLLLPLGFILCWPAIRLAVPAGQKIVFEYVTALPAFQIMAAWTASMIPVLGLLPAALRGARRGKPSHAGQLARDTAPLVLVAAISGFLKLLVLRYLWEKSLSYPFTPMVSLWSLDYWATALWGAVFATIVQCILILRAPSRG